MKVLLCLVLVAIVLLGLGCESPGEPAAGLTDRPASTAISPVETRPAVAPAIVPLTSRSQDRVPAQVVRVIDGDTIEVEMDGQLYTVRYIGVDTPETKHPTKGVQPYGPEASERNRQLVEGRTVKGGEIMYHLGGRALRCGV